MIKALPSAAVLFFCFCLTIFSSGCILSGALFSPAPPSGRTLTPPSTEPFVLPDFNLDNSVKETGIFDAEVRKLVNQRQFDRLEDLARDLAGTKARFVGGGWKIKSFYSCATSLEGDSEEDWQKEFDFLQAWKKAKPQSIIPRSLLASAYISYAWKARGSGFAKEVNEDSWQVFQRRLEAAEREITEASKLEARDHLYFGVRIALAKAMNKGDKASEYAFLRAVGFEPDYQYYYGEYALSLMPRWGGSQGDWEKFAEKIKDSKGGSRGLQIYYLIVADISDLSSQNFFSENQISWKDAKEGYRLLVEEYGGTTRLHLNRFAKLALLAQDNSAMCAAIRHIRTEDDFAKQIWRGIIADYGVVKSTGEDACKSGPSWSMAR